MSTAKNSLKRDRPVSPPVPAGPLALRLQWSDGTITWHAGTNGPTEDMLDPSADESGATNYMRPVDRYSKKEIHWLLKLAEELAKSKDPGLLKKVGGGKLIFESLPEGYRLFEQVQMPVSCSPRKEYAAADEARDAMGARHALTHICMGTPRARASGSGRRATFCHT